MALVDDINSLLGKTPKAGKDSTSIQTVVATATVGAEPAPDTTQAPASIPRTACNNPNMAWSFNAGGSTPCDLYQSLEQICIPDWSVGVLSTAYTPATGNSNKCSCNIIAFNLASACWACQNSDDMSSVGTTWSSWSGLCTGDNAPIYPASTDISSQAYALSLPRWVYDYPNAGVWDMNVIKAAGTSIIPPPSASPVVSVIQVINKSTVSLPDATVPVAAGTIAPQSQALGSSNLAVQPTTPTSNALQAFTVSRSGGGSGPSASAALTARPLPMSAISPGSSLSRVAFSSNQMTESDGNYDYDTMRSSESARNTTIGGVVGGIGGLAIFLLFFFGISLCMRRRRRKRLEVQGLQITSFIDYDEENSYQEPSFLAHSSDSDSRRNSSNVLIVGPVSFSEQSFSHTTEIPAVIAGTSSPRLLSWLPPPSESDSRMERVQEEDAGRAPSLLARAHNAAVIAEGEAEEEMLADPNQDNTQASAGPSKKIIPPPYRGSWLRRSVLNGTAATNADDSRSIISSVHAV